MQNSPRNLALASAESLKSNYLPFTFINKEVIETLIAKVTTNEIYMKVNYISAD